MHVKIMYGWTDRGHHRTPPTDHTFAPVDLTAPKVAAGKNVWDFLLFSPVSVCLASVRIWGAKCHFFNYPNGRVAPGILTAARYFHHPPSSASEF